MCDLRTATTHLGVTIFHPHKCIHQPGVGEIQFCLTWFKQRIKAASFRPDLPGAQWHDVPLDSLASLVEANSAMEAMAIIRKGDTQ